MKRKNPGKAERCACGEPVEWRCPNCNAKVCNFCFSSAYFICRGCLNKYELRGNPWSGKADVARHNKKAAADSEACQLWLRVANKVYEETGDDGKAVKIANIVVKKHLAKKKKNPAVLLAKPIWKSVSRLMRFIEPAAFAQAHLSRHEPYGRGRRKVKADGFARNLEQMGPLAAEHFHDELERSEGLAAAQSFAAELVARFNAGQLYPELWQELAFRLSFQYGLVLRWQA